MIKSVFESAAQMPAIQKKHRASIIAQKKTKAARFIQVTKTAKKHTWRMGSYVILSLERIGEGVDNIPRRVTS